ncbi:putative RNA-binding protein with PIN domain [Scopulibacillus daqui]|uniref:RNA-binding protein with PIN domain n=1 Tax=Scopulibacillus daqui TaxID=1469162 RepID=A0ABS2Q366_9BACL|nr:NYN domain-containing protein [Scopulibacillus daqui]MBM7646739.1 putative RNA-binding protein with PIN domain [Scopulibacillus daqui]
MDILLVDGYNVIGAWDELKKLKDIDFAQARDLLIDKLAEYQAYKGWRVIIVFDAHLVPGIEIKHIQSRVEVIYTRENETADERIEKMVKELNNVKTRIYVATSDYTEQWTIFSQGALRVSSRELLNEINKIEKQINDDITRRHTRKTRTKIPMNEEITRLFEKWRRGF